jgi:hypothetical protein
VADEVDDIWEEVSEEFSSAITSTMQILTEFTRSLGAILLKA